ncbi:hypothetical protein DES53_115122 [Roseimicrobium gellanilyticum]|uniref:Uncharacterized protein n=1 Tax=Roseimicrobium gellanilyticum TaxID=748857 RepID=A0A366H696_9BACT|nr:hypothetical protein [Roseimicrobium gellanilyticum]RBP36981.1 hypothetical protein DES53_115122 [Roseimicrobium gellanilyticum]
MSRRTKLLVAALFLVPFTILVVALFLTWSPANPLRIRMERLVETPEILRNDGYTYIEFTVENTSPIPVYLISLRTAHSEETANLHEHLTYVTATQLDSDLRTHLSSGMIPAHSSVVFTELWPKEGERVNESASYVWASAPKRTVIGILAWIHRHTPKSLQKHHLLPHVPPNVDVTPISPSTRPDAPLTP